MEAMMSRIETYEANTFSALITWKLADGSVKDLTGATIEAVAGGTTLTAIVSDGAAGQVRVSAPANTFTPGISEMQVRVTKDGVTRTYAATLLVRNSLAA